MDKVVVKPLDIRGAGNIRDTGYGTYVNVNSARNVVYGSAMGGKHIVYHLKSEKAPTSILAGGSSTAYVGQDYTISGIVMSGTLRLTGVPVKIYSNDILADTLTTDNNGTFQFHITHGNNGNVSYRVVHEGDLTHYPSERTINVSVIKQTPSLTLSGSASGSTVNLSGALTGLGTNGQSIDIYQQSESNHNWTKVATVTTGSTGLFTESLANMSNQNYAFQARLASTYAFEAVNSEMIAVEVNNKANPTITLASTSQNQEIVYGESNVTLTGTLSVGSGASVKIYDNNTLVDTVTTSGSNGDFSKTVSGLSIGNHQFKAVFEGNNNYNSVTSSNIGVKIIQRSVNITLTAPSSVNPSETFTISGVMKYGNTPLSGKTVQLWSIDDENAITTVTTDSNGAFSITRLESQMGTYLYYATFDGDSTYKAYSSSSVRVYVKSSATLSLSANTTNMPVGNSVTLSGNLSVGAGKTVNIYKNEELFDTLTTGTDGVFTANYKMWSEGTFRFQATWSGDEDYTSCSSSVIHVSVSNPYSTTPVVTLTTNNATKYVGAGYSLTGYLTINGTGMHGAEIFIYEGNTLIRTVTSSSGGYFSSGGITGAYGEHKYYAVFDGASRYAPAVSETLTVNVIKRTATLTASAERGSGSSVIVTGNLSAGSGKIVNLYRTYDATSIPDEFLANATTDANGDFTITRNIGGGSTIYVEFEEDDYYYEAKSSSMTP